HAAEAADVELAGLALGHGVAVVVQERDLDAGRRPAARAGFFQHVLGPQDRSSRRTRRNTDRSTGAPPPSPASGTAPPPPPASASRTRRNARAPIRAGRRCA